ncbi:MAG: amidohydrolase [Verrucomicrobia bacterium]|nr:amidohydrolase [Verrucomicrobiota bacterium]
MGVIDSHVHLYPPDVNRDPAGWAAACGEPLWAQLCTRRRKNGRGVQAFPSVDELLRAMDAADVERAVLLGWYWEMHASCALQNRFYGECVRAHPDRLAAFATINPRADRALVREELDRARGEGLVGLGELSPHTQGYAVDNAAFGAVLELAERWAWPVNLHVTDPDSRPYPGRVATPLEDFLLLGRTYPRVNFVLAHWGGLLPLRDPAAVELKNLHYDTAASPLLYGPDVWRRFMATVPAERVHFGSDYPLNVYPTIDAEPNFTRLVAEAHRSGLDATQLKALMRENSARWFKR